MDLSKPVKLLKKLEEEGKVIPATYDRAFKRVMTNCKDYLALLLSNFIDIPKEEIKKHLVYKNTELISSSYFEKRKIADLVVEVEDNIINLEMNSSYYSKVIARNNAYYHKIATTLYKEGEEYSDVAIIQINFDNYNLYEDEDVVLEFGLLNVKKHYEAKENLKIYHINLARLREKYYNEEELEDVEKELLVLCLDDRKSLDIVSKNDNTLRSVRCELEDMSQNLDFLLFYDEEEEKERINKCKIEDAKNAGHDAGLKEGKSIGLEEGKLQIAKEMLKDKVGIDTVAKYTGLTIEELENLEK